MIWDDGQSMETAPHDECILCAWGQTEGPEFEVLNWCDGVWMNMEEMHFYPIMWWPLPKRVKCLSEQEDA